MKAEYDELLKQGAKTEVLETAKQEIARRDIHILSGHNWNRVLGSIAAGTAIVDEVLDDPEDPHVKFSVPLPKDETTLPTYFQDVIREIQRDISTAGEGVSPALGVSPGFFIPPESKVPNAVKYVDEPGSKEGVRIRVVRAAVLVELSLVFRSSYSETGVDVRGFDMYEEPARKKRVKRWL